MSSNDHTRQIAKEVASFANTYGGILLIGVEEKSLKPITPILGIEFVEKLDEKITSIAFKNINPPIFPEVKICRLKNDSSKAVILIRVHESNETPHRIDQDTKVYIRVKSQNEPVLAPFSQVEFLQNRREKAVKLKEYLLRRADERSSSVVGCDRIMQSICIAPLYPHGHLIPYAKLPGIVKDKVVTYADWNFPAATHNPSTCDESVVYARRDEERAVDYTEVNSFGVVFHKEVILRLFGGVHRTIEFSDAVTIYCVALLFAKKFYNVIGYWGSLGINIILENVKNVGMTFNDNRNEFDSTIRLNYETSLSDLSDNIHETYLKISRDVLWSFNQRRLAQDEKVIREILDGILSMMPEGKKV